MTVYFIKPIGFEGPIKIGVSLAPEQRADQLACWSPFPLEIVATINGDLKIERRFHGRFADDHLGHEWFKTTPDLLAVIAEIQACAFDVETLPAPKSLRSPSQTKRAKWSDEHRKSILQNNALRRAEKASGLVLDWPARKEKWEAFVANPCRKTGGITREELVRIGAKRVAAHHRELADEHERRASTPAQVAA